METILITGGAGYIGSHVCKALKQAGYLPVTFDNLSHGHEWAVRFGPFFHGDLQNSEDLDRAFIEYSPRCVIHLAGSIHLRESIVNPHQHYYNNVVGTLSLLKAMVKHDISNLVFSSSAAIYATPKYLPLDEDHPKDPINPYGKTKWMSEQIISDFSFAHGLNAVCLRYFNAAGADPDCEIGEAHNPETHLIPRLLFTAQKKQEFFTIYNQSLPTEDGTAVRDYVHVSDLASAHVLSHEWLKKESTSTAFNLGTGRGFSVLQLIEKAREITGCPIPTKVHEEHFAELPILIADPKKAKEVLNWFPGFSDLDTIIETAWSWHNRLVLANL